MGTPPSAGMRVPEGKVLHVGEKSPKVSLSKWHKVINLKQGFAPLFDMTDKEFFQKRCLTAPPTHTHSPLRPAPSCLLLLLMFFSFFFLVIPLFSLFHLLYLFFIHLSSGSPALKKIDTVGWMWAWWVRSDCKKICSCGVPCAAWRPELLFSPFFYILLSFFMEISPHQSWKHWLLRATYAHALLGGNFIRNIQHVFKLLQIKSRSANLWTTWTLKYWS